jgi:hypothetical protein
MSEKRRKRKKLASERKATINSKPIVFVKMICRYFEQCMIELINRTISRIHPSIHCMTCVLILW